MNVFAQYAHYYNFLYRDKDYVQEAQYVHQLFRRYAPGTRSILEFGCGTGHHACLLAQEGYQVQGVDLSATMLQHAAECQAQSAPELRSSLAFSQGDIRTIRLPQTFDAVIALFHVISYQTTNEDIVAAFQTANAHLKPEGLFIFDFWYGPAVLTDRPTVRVKRWEDDLVHIMRVAEPVMYPNENIVEVNYEVIIQHKQSQTVETLRETHRMRYLFYPELLLMLNSTQFAVLDHFKWMSQTQPLNFDAWNGVVITRKSGQIPC
jgi:SAM-dependent methyltransferase